MLNSLQLYVDLPFENLSCLQTIHSSVPFLFQSALLQQLLQYARASNEAVIKSTEILRYPKLNTILIYLNGSFVCSYLLFIFYSYTKVKFAIIHYFNYFLCNFVFFTLRFSINEFLNTTNQIQYIRDGTAQAFYLSIRLPILQD